MTNYPHIDQRDLPSDAGAILGLHPKWGLVYLIDEHEEWVGFADLNPDTGNVETGTRGGDTARQILKDMGY